MIPSMVPEVVVTTGPKSGFHLASMSMLSLTLQPLLMILILSPGMDPNTGILMAALSNVVCFALTFRVKEDFGVWWRASVVGYMVSVGVGLAYADISPAAEHFGWFLLLLAGFHISHFVTVALTDPVNLNTDAFLLNYSREHYLALVISCVEFGVEMYYLPFLKSLRVISLLGLVMCLGGEALRKLTMIQAGTNFNHFALLERRRYQVLVVDGIYGVMRHPFYLGWYCWSVGMQIVLCNPLCTVFGAMLSWQLFFARVYVEEANLLALFGQTFQDYKRKVDSGLPGIKGI